MKKQKIEFILKKRRICEAFPKAMAKTRNENDQCRLQTNMRNIRYVYR